MTNVDPKMLKIKQIDQKISEKCISFCKIPTQDKNQGISPNPTACPQTYWEAPSQLPTQFPPLSITIFTNPLYHWDTPHYGTQNTTKVSQKSTKSKVQ